MSFSPTGHIDAVWKCSESISLAIKCLQDYPHDELICDKACRILKALAKVDRSLWHAHLPGSPFTFMTLSLCVLCVCTATKSKVRGAIAKDPSLKVFKKRIL